MLILVDGERKILLGTIIFITGFLVSGSTNIVAGITCADIVIILMSNINNIGKRIGSIKESESIVYCDWNNRWSRKYWSSYWIIGGTLFLFI
jgi:hypothetical protein